MRRPLPLRPNAVAVGVATLAALGVFGASASAPAGAAAAATKSAQSEYEAALKAAANQSVHFETNVTEGDVTLQQIGDAGAHAGSQTLTIRNGSATEHMSAEVVGKVGYVKGNSTALRNIIGLTAAQTKKYEGKWLSFPMSNATLAQLAAGLLGSQVATELSFTGPYSFASDATLNGRSATGVVGRVSESNGSWVAEVLYVPSTGKPLPIEEVTNPHAKAKATTVHGNVMFSNWGEHVAVSAPAHSTSLLKLAPVSSSGATTTTGG